jgi:6-phosphogluconolactonase
VFRNIWRNRLYQFDDLSGSDTTSAKGREANYGAGSVGVVAIEQDGSLGACTDLATLPGEPGPNCKEQASSHPHECPFDRAGRFILVPDKGLDRVFNFLFDGAHGKLMPNNPPCRNARRCRTASHRVPPEPTLCLCDRRDSTRR